MNKSTLGVPRGRFCSIFGPFRDPFGHRFFDVFRNSVNSRKPIKTNVFSMILPLRPHHFSTYFSLIFHVLFGTPLGEHFWRPKRRPILQKSILGPPSDSEGSQNPLRVRGRTQQSVSGRFSPVAVSLSCTAPYLTSPFLYVISLGKCICR